MSARSGLSLGSCLRHYGGVARLLQESERALFAATFGGSRGLPRSSTVPRLPSILLLLVTMLQSPPSGTVTVSGQVRRASGSHTIYSPSRNGREGGGRAARPGSPGPES